MVSKIAGLVKVAHRIFLMVDVAQLARALDRGSRGREFDSHRSPNLPKSNNRGSSPRPSVKGNPSNQMGADGLKVRGMPGRFNTPVE